MYAIYTNTAYAYVCTCTPGTALMIRGVCKYKCGAVENGLQSFLLHPFFIGFPASHRNRLKYTTFCTLSGCFCLNLPSAIFTT